MGFALAGLSVGTNEGIQNSIIYLIIYLIMNIAFFCCLFMLKRENQYFDKVEDLSGLSKNHPLLSLSMMIILFSLAGIPPLAGFFGKWLVFSAAVKSGLLALTIIGVLTSVVGAFYYLKIVKIIYFEDVESPIDQLENKTVNFILLLMILLTLGFGLIMSWFLNIFVNSSFVL